MKHLSLILILLLPMLALAQPKPAPAPKKAPTSGILVRDGHKGMWFPMPKARQLLKDVKLLEGAQRTLKKTEDRLDLEKERSKLLDKNVKSSEKISELWKSTAETQAKALAQKDAWWKSPYLWTVVGFVVGTATTVGITFAVNRSGAAK
jgi:hypothetical protein